ncbi:MAG: hemerythrin domain-containing protein [Phycisphaerae bacterium]
MTDEHPPLKRHESLQPFSRDHFVALRVARDLSSAASADGDSAHHARDAFLAAWREEISSHFDEEEKLLIPLMRAAEIERMMREHHQLRRLADEAISAGNGKELQAWCAEVGQALHDHVRWEERVLFMAIQDRATPEQLKAVGLATAEIEARRPGCRRRGPGPRGQDRHPSK